MGNILMAVLVALSISPAVLAQQDEEARVFRVEYLEEQEAGLFARQLCLQESRAQCDYKIRGRGFIEVYADAGTLDEIGEMLSQRDVPPKTQVFQVTLIVASSEGRPDARISRMALEALEDIQNILPYRGYRVLDTGIMRTSDEARLSLGGELGYQAALRFRGDPNTERPLYVEAFELEQHYTRWIAAPPDPAGGGDPSKSRENVSRRVVSASFSMESGETVVVGTSKLNGGDEALIVLLTALED